MPVPTYDWDQISKEFIQGIQLRDAETNEIKLHFPTHEELCEKHGCSFHTIRQKSFQEKWKLQRTQYLRKVRAKNRELNLNDLLGIGTKFEAYHLQHLETVQVILGSMLEPYKQAIEDPDSLEDFELRRLNTNDLKNIVQVIRETHHLVRDIIGEEKNPTNLLDEIREEYNLKKAGRGDSRQFAKQKLKKLAKQAEEAELLKEELELKKKLLQQKLLEATATPLETKEEERGS